MLYLPTILSVIEVLAINIPILLIVAFITIAERKTMASMQRRLGPNSVGLYGLLQAFADALKLLLKEYVSPTQANMILFFIGPIITLIFSLLGYAVIPYGVGLILFDYNLSILYILAMSSLATYGILIAGWSANSKYTFLGSLRSTAQLISYELILSSVILLIVLLAGSLDVSVIIEAQRVIWNIVPLFPIFIVFITGSIAETNRAPFDLAEAESELVSGFMTEHSAVIFVFFFLAEYASIVLICIINSILFLGGYILDVDLFIFVFIFLLEKASILFINVFTVFIFIINILISIIDFLIYIVEDMVEKIAGLSIKNAFFELYYEYKYISSYVHDMNYRLLYEHHNIDHSFFQYVNDIDDSVYNYNPSIESVIHSIIIGCKTCIMIFIFIWARASFPRIRFDQLMLYCWTVLLPVVIASIILVPCILYGFEIMPCNIPLL